MADLFDTQDEIVARLANQLGAQFIAAEARRAEQAPHPDSMHLYFQGMACINKGWTAELLSQASQFILSALRCDSKNVEVIVGAAGIDILRVVNFLAIGPRHLPGPKPP